MHLQNLHLFCQDDGKPEGLLRRRMRLYFSCSFQTLTGGSSISVHQGGSTDLIAPKDSSQTGSLSRWATLLPLNARSVRPSVRPCKKVKPAHPHNSWKSVFSLRTLVQNAAGSQACAQTPFIYSSMLFSRGDKETVKTHRNSKKKKKEKKGKRSIARKMLLAHSQ